MIISVAGSGGKTTYIKQLKDYYLKQGQTVLITTTTHMQKEIDTLVNPSIEMIIANINKYGYAFAGKNCENNKISKLDCLDALKDKIDIILIEADGSKHLPLKYCRKNEPVIEQDSDKIIVITNLIALNKPIKDVVHRYQEACLKFGWHESDYVNASVVQKLLRECYINKMNCEIKVNSDHSLYQRCIKRLLEENKDVDMIQEGWFLPANKLVILGGGHVSKQLCKIAKLLDFYTIIVDDRIEFANKKSFPDADEIHFRSFDDINDICPHDKNTCYVIVTRGHQYDAKCLKQVIDKPHLYIGMMGSQAKIKNTYALLNLSQEIIDDIHAPIGLKINSQTPGEIAISILSEIIAIKNEKAHSSICQELLNTKLHGVLCILLEKTGSTPRGIGSMMLVHDDGIIDTIGGGKIEYEVIQDARQCHEVQIKSYYLNNKDSSNIGMICGGSNKILFIPI